MPHSPAPALAAAPHSPGAQPRRQPNVVVFFTDQQRWDCSGLHGNPLDLMPNFDRMAQQGTHLAHSFTCQPVCAPARSSLQTGQYATTTGTWRNGIPLSPSARTLAMCFREAGYHTGYIGKWHLADDARAGGASGPVRPEQRGGYEEWLASNILEFTSDAYNLRLYDNGGAEHHLPGYRVDAQTDAAIRFIHRHQDRPFFLFNSYIEPHHQNSRDDYPAPDGYEERYRNAAWTPPDLAALGGTTDRHLPGYYGMVKRLDEALGRTLDALKSLDLLDNTILLFTSDHGCHFKTRNGEYKRSCHDASLRVPTAFTGPGFRSGGTVQQLVSLVDLPPTLLEAAGVPVPAAMQGRSLMPVLRGEPGAGAAWPGEILAQISESEVGRTLRTARWKYSVTALGKNGSQHSCSDIYTETHLYDLAEDPAELHNLAGLPSHRDVAAELRVRLIRRIVEAGEAEPHILPAAVSAAFANATP